MEKHRLTSITRCYANTENPQEVEFSERGVEITKHNKECANTENPQEVEFLLDEYRLTSITRSYANTENHRGGVSCGVV